ncbi:uncharacterized protein LOC131669405 [Phymastichus coffea]|uniref:uncharacterized protein LOC131669405 n=1 Tax=Phymastichus coffea TaxID=108790 RepID=UPI00273B82EB|nr:uncharacterized protein LOC131669405 [Phymastichus coffea]
MESKSQTNMNKKNFRSQSKPNHIRRLNYSNDSSELEDVTSGSEYQPENESSSSDENSDSDFEEYIDQSGSESSSNDSISTKSYQNINIKKRKRNEKVYYPESESVTEDLYVEVNDIEQQKNLMRKKLSEEFNNNNVEYNSTSVILKDKSNLDLDTSHANSSLELTINLNSVGKVMKDSNKLLFDSKSGIKKYSCYYCTKKKLKTKNNKIKSQFANLNDHYEKAHKNEDLIIKLKKYARTARVKGQPLNDDQKKRKQILELLTSKANHLNNINAQEVSEIVVARRPRENSGYTIKNYGTCYKCFKMLSLTSIHKHVHTCTGQSFIKKHVIKSSSRATQGNYHAIAKADSIEIISKMRNINIVDVIRYDDAVFFWLNAEAQKFETARQHHKQIRANLSKLGNFLNIIKEININIQELSDTFHEDFYDDVIEAIKTMGKPDPITGLMTAPSSAHNMFFLINNVASVYEIMIGTKQEVKRKQVQAFLNKFKKMWHSSIGNTIAETMANIKEIIKKNYLIKKTCYENLRDALVSYLHITNCRRSGEIEMLRIDDFSKIDFKDDKCRIEVRGKRKKPVPIVFNKMIYNYLKCLIRLRPKAQILKDNPFVFATILDVSKKNFSFVSACNLMAKFADLCGAEKPETLRGTRYRMQMATESLKKGIDNHQLEKLTAFMGHTKGIHCQNYRQSVLERDLEVANSINTVQSCKSMGKDKPEQQKENQSTEALSESNLLDEACDESAQQNQDQHELKQSFRS